MTINVYVSKEKMQSWKKKKLLTGSGVYPGMVFGYVRNVGEGPDRLDEPSPELMAEVQQGDIIVANPPKARLHIALLKIASAVVIDNGGRTCGTAICARELQVPTVTGTYIGTKVLKTGQTVIVDATEGAVYSASMPLI